ncbi:MAG: glycosyltransferase family 4 protein [Verrucomicrobiota bacterium]|nr:glycosyltransferase family 4 protein [Verrucomicrobiota bacterium]
MRFLFLTLGWHPEQTGGAFRYVAELGERLAVRGHHVSILFPSQTPDQGPATSSNGSHLIRFQKRAASYWNWKQEIREIDLLLAHLPSDTIVIQCHAYFSHVARARKQQAFLFTGPWAEEYLIRFRGERPTIMQSLHALYMRRVEKNALRRSSRIFTISKYYQDHLPLWHPTRLPHIQMIGAGVNLKRFLPLERNDLRAMNGLNPSDFLLLAVRRLEARMGLDLLIQAVGAVRKRHSNLKLWIAGSGAEEQFLKRQIHTLSLEQSVQLMGHVTESQLVDLYNMADCSIVPSIALEGFGLSSVESLACGTPVLASRQGGSLEILNPFSPQFLFEPGSSTAIEQLLSTILNGNLKFPSREQCRSYAQQNFSWEKVAAEFEMGIQILPP